MGAGEKGYIEEMVGGGGGGDVGIGGMCSESTFEGDVGVLEVGAGSCSDSVWVCEVLKEAGVVAGGVVLVASVEKGENTVVELEGGMFTALKVVSAATVAIAGDDGVGGLCVDNVDGEAVLGLCTKFGEVGATANGESEAAIGLPVASAASDGPGQTSSCAEVISV